MKKLGLRLRDVIFGGMGTYILYHEVVVSTTAEPLLIFTAFFLLGLIPASRADGGDGSSGGGLSVKGLLREWLSEKESPPSDPASKSKKDQDK